MRETEEMERVHLWLYKADIKFLDQVLGGAATRSKMIRTIVRKNCNGMREKVAQRGKAVEWELDEGDLA